MGTKVLIISSPGGFPSTHPSFRSIAPAYLFSFQDQTTQEILRSIPSSGPQTIITDASTTRDIEPWSFTLTLDRAGCCNYPRKPKRNFQHWKEPREEPPQKIFVRTSNPKGDIYEYENFAGGKDEVILELSNEIGAQAQFPRWISNVGTKTPFLPTLSLSQHAFFKTGSKLLSSNLPTPPPSRPRVFSGCLLPPSSPRGCLRK